MKANTTIKLISLLLLAAAGVILSTMTKPDTIDIMDAQCEPLADTTLPEGYPTNVPVYPNSTRVQASILPQEEHGESGENMFFVVYCSSDNYLKIADYFVKTPTGWNLKDTGVDPKIIPDQKVLAGENSGHELLIHIDGTQIEGVKSKTVIKYQIPIQ